MTPSWRSAWYHACDCDPHRVSCNLNVNISTQILNQTSSAILLIAWCLMHSWMHRLWFCREEWCLSVPWKEEVAAMWPVAVECCHSAGFSLSPTILPGSPHYCHSDHGHRHMSTIDNILSTGDIHNNVLDIVNLYDQNVWEGICVLRSLFMVLGWWWW